MSKVTIKTVMLHTETFEEVIPYVATQYVLKNQQRSDKEIHDEMKSLGYNKTEYKIVQISFEVQDAN